MDMTIPRISPQAMLAVVVALGLVACSSDEGYAPDKGDAGADVSVDASVDVSSDGGDADVETPDADTGDIEDTDIDSPPEVPWTECDCPEPEEKCTARDFCGLPDAECGPDVDDECPDGYTCQRPVAGSESFVCVCKGDDEFCVSECDSQDDCELSNQNCSYQDGVCRWSTGPCHDSAFCPEGYYCASRCEPTEGRELGEECESNEECHSTICNGDTGKCDERCLSDGDCDDGEVCTPSAGESSGDGCESSNCEFSCPPDTRCGGNGCLPAVCETTADCESGDCVFDPYMLGSGPGRCVERDGSERDRYCKPEELMVGKDGTCQLPGPCWDDSHCDEPYECTGSCTRAHDDEEDS